jgi:hypothetical protein
MASAPSTTFAAVNYGLYELAKLLNMDTLYFRLDRRGKSEKISKDSRIAPFMPQNFGFCHF